MKKVCTWCGPNGIDPQYSRNFANSAIPTKTSTGDEKEAIATINPLYPIEPPKQDGAMKFNKGKSRLSLLQGKALAAVIEVAEMGAEKYEKHNYRKGRPVTEWIDAAYRHAFDAWLFRGEDLDPESQKNHLAHAAWNLLTALEQMIDKPELDDRYSKKRVDSGSKTDIE